METAADRGAFVADFGEGVVITPAGQASEAAVGIFDAAFLEAAERFGTGIASRGTALTLPTESLPSGVERGTVVVSADRGTFEVAEVHPDGTGYVHLILERTS